MKRAFFLAVLIVSALALPLSAGAQQLPKVWVGGPFPPPCYRSVQVHGKWVEDRVACYEVRPPTIALSADGNGSLSLLRWTTWTATKAVATGYRFVRCWGSYPQGKQDPYCTEAARAQGGYYLGVSVVLTKPVNSPQGQLFSVLREPGEPGLWCLAPTENACALTPRSTTTTTAPPVTIGGPWEFVGFSQSGEAVDVVHLTLVNFPPGHLTGTWSESAAPGYEPGLALNVTECVGCNGVAGAYHNEFGVVGSVQGGTFTIEVQNNDSSSFSGALGNATPYGATRYGCRPSVLAGEMFLVSGSSAYLFFRPQGFPGVAVGRQVSC
jgi:hypothetical protein